MKLTVDFILGGHFIIVTFDVMLKQKINVPDIFDLIN